MKLSTKQSLSKIESWLDKKGFVLCKSKKKTIEDEVDFERKVVFLSLRSKPIHQIYSVLHECGHIILRSKKTYKEDFKTYIKVCEGDALHNTRSLVEEVEEEIIAWRQGEALAKKLEIYLDKDEYYKYGYKWVMGYIALAAVGKEIYLPSAKETKETQDIEQNENKKLDLCKLLDNAHDPCYYRLIPKPEP